MNCCLLSGSGINCTIHVITFSYCEHRNNRLLTLGWRGYFHHRQKRVRSVAKISSDWRQQIFTFFFFDFSAFEPAARANEKNIRRVLNGNCVYVHASHSSLPMIHTKHRFSMLPKKWQCTRKWIFHSRLASMGFSNWVIRSIGRGWVCWFPRGSLLIGKIVSRESLSSFSG